MLRNKQDMLHGPLLGSIIRYSIPIILTSLLQLFFNAADLVVVGRFCGSLSVAAVGATGSITTLVVNLFIGLGVGVNLHRPVCAFCWHSRMAQKEPRETRTLIEPSLVLGIEPQPGFHSRCFPESDLCWPLQRSWRRQLNSGSLQFWVPQRLWSLWQRVLSGNSS